MKRKTFFQLLFGGISSVLLFNKTSVASVFEPPAPDNLSFIPPEGANQPMGTPRGIDPQCFG